MIKFIITRKSGWYHCIFSSPESIHIYFFFILAGVAKIIYTAKVKILSNTSIITYMLKCSPMPCIEIPTFSLLVVKTSFYIYACHPIFCFQSIFKVLRSIRFYFNWIPRDIYILRIFKSPHTLISTKLFRMS